VFWVNQIKPAGDLLLYGQKKPGGGAKSKSGGGAKSKPSLLRRIFLTAALPFKNHRGTHGIA